MTPGDLVVTGIGAQTPIGRSWPASAAAARAGVCGFQEHPFMIDSAGEPVRVAAAPWLDTGIAGTARCDALLIEAIDEAMAPLSDAGDVRSRLRLGLVLALPPVRPGRPAHLAESALAAVARQWPQRFVSAAAIEAGHAAGYVALDRAMAALAGGDLEACLVAGVDSYLEPETLEWLDACDQLHGGGRDNNAWGFIPGEAAGALLLMTEPAARRRALDIDGILVSVGVGREPHLIKSDAVCLGEGLTRAFRTALGVLPPGARIDQVYCDLNGEPYRADEYGFTVLRTRERFRAATDFVAPADCWGDVGAAGAVLHVGLGLMASRKGYATGPLSLAWGSSESGERGAAVVRGVVRARG